MFRISFLETGIVCAIVALVIIIPMIVARGYSRLNKRLKDIENKIEKKK